MPKSTRPRSKRHRKAPTTPNSIAAVPLSSENNCESPRSLFMSGSFDQFHGIGDHAVANTITAEIRCARYLDGVGHDLRAVAAGRRTTGVGDSLRWKINHTGDRLTASPGKRIVAARNPVPVAKEYDAGIGAAGGRREAHSLV